jgi:hypothetical protein
MLVVLVGVAGKECDNQRHVRLAYQPPASSTFLSQQISHQQPASSTFLSEQTSTSHQPNEQAAGMILDEMRWRHISLLLV